MVSKKLNSRAVSKSAGTNNLSANAIPTSQTQQSLLLKQSFAPSKFQLNLFASVIQGLESQILRVHDTVTGKCAWEHHVKKGKVSCLAWGRYNGHSALHDRPTKKRKTKAGTADGHQGEVVIALGLSNEAGIELVSASSGDRLAVWNDDLPQGVRDFCFGPDQDQKAWSIGGDGKLVEWNLEDGSHSEPVSLRAEVAASNVLHEASGLLFSADKSIFAFDPFSPADSWTFSGFAGSVHSVEVDSKDGKPVAVLGASSDESNVVVFEYAEEARILGNLVGTAPIKSICASGGGSPNPLTLAVVNERGVVELFDTPFRFKSTKGLSLKEANKNKIRRPRASIQISRPGGKEAVSVSGVSIERDEMVLSWVEGGVNPAFHRMLWRDNKGEVCISGNVHVEKAKDQSGLASARLNGIDKVKAQVDDADAIIVQGNRNPNAMDVDDEQSDEDLEAADMSEDDDDDDDDDEKAATKARAKPLTNGIHKDETLSDSSDHETAEFQIKSTNSRREDDDGETDEEVDQEPTFGDLLRAKAPEPVDVSAAFASQAQTALVPPSKKALSLPGGMSLGTALAQSLRTNDRGLLETCLHEQDLQIVRATIERLDSTLAGNLVERLSQRLHNRPGRAGSLMVWAQWTLIVHGGYLAGQPKVVEQLRQLHEVVKERAQALPYLLLLKGKLDMLQEQMRLRKDKVERSKVLQAAREEEEEDAIYIEGQEDESSDDENEAEEIEDDDAPAPEDINFDSDDEEEADEMPNAMDVDEDDDDDDESVGVAGLIDDEADETLDDSGMDDDIDHDDVDTADEAESESEVDELPAKAKGKPKVNGIKR